eukprot:6182259-Pleurochrysis_carterae.AAC.2
MHFSSCSQRHSRPPRCSAADACAVGGQLGDNLVVIVADDGLLQVSLRTHKLPKFAIVPGKPRLLGAVQSDALLVVLVDDLTQSGMRPAKAPPEEVDDVPGLAYLNDTQRTCADHARDDDAGNGLGVLVVGALELLCALKEDVFRRADEHVHQAVALDVVPAVSDDRALVAWRARPCCSSAYLKLRHRLVQEATCRHYTRTQSHKAAWAAMHA